MRAAIHNGICSDQILKLAKRDDHPFGNSLIIELQGLVLVRGYSDLNASEIAGTYSTKYYINQKFTKVPTIQGWLPLIPNLEKLSETNGT